MVIHYPVAAGVAGLLSLGLQSTEYLYNYYTACRGQHRDLANLADRLGGLLESLQIIDDIVRRRIRRCNEQSIIQNIERAITHSEDAITVLQGEVDKLKNEPSDDWKRKVVVVGRRAAYPFKRSTLEDLSDDVSDFQDNLSIALQTLQLKEHQNTQGDIEEVKAIVQDIQAQSVRADLRQWLRAPDATINFNVAAAKRHQAQDSAGKFILVAIWLRRVWEIRAVFNGDSARVSSPTIIRQHAAAFFFFDFRDDSKQDASAALRALLLQLCGQVSALEADLNCLKHSYNHGTPPVPVLLEYVRQVILRCDHIYILLDALDESPVDPSGAESYR